MAVDLRDLVNRIPLKGDLAVARDIYNMSRSEGGFKRGVANYVVNRVIPEDMEVVRDLYKMSRGEGGLRGGLINWGIGRVLIPIEKLFSGMGLRKKQDILRSPGGILQLIRASQKLPDYPNLQLDTSAVTPVEGWKRPTLPPSYNLLRMEADD